MKLYKTKSSLITKKDEESANVNKSVSFKGAAENPHTDYMR
jgi:hypothetical protein